ncbi:hypothetical protein ACSBR2_007669 [Camellia fascicularis]
MALPITIDELYWIVPLAFSYVIEILQEKCQSTLSSIAAKAGPSKATRNHRVASAGSSSSTNTKPPAPAVKFSNDTERLQHINSIHKGPIGAQIKRFIDLLFEFSFYFPAIMVIDNSTPAAIPPSSAMSSMSDMPVSPTSVASTGHFPFTASDIVGVGVDTSTLDTTFTSDVANSVGLQIPPDNRVGNSKDSLRSLSQIPWNFSLSDLTADLSNLGGTFRPFQLLYTCIISGFKALPFASTFLAVEDFYRYICICMFVSVFVGLYVCI